MRFRLFYYNTYNFRNAIVGLLRHCLWWTFCSTSRPGAVLLEFFVFCHIDAYPYTAVFPYHVRHRRRAAASCQPDSALEGFTSSLGSQVCRLQPGLTIPS